MPYHTTINQTTAIRRAFKIQAVLPPGMGTIYAWDWAYVLSHDNEKKTNVSLDNNSIRFSYIGLANQITTGTRISQHISDAKKKNERGLYVALNDALNKGESTYKNSTENFTKSGNGVVEIIHLASLFDLAALETHLIKEEKLELTNKSNNFADLIKNIGEQSRGSKVGLNTLGGGQGDPLGEGTTTSIAEWILAGYMYFIEKDKEILASRKYNVNGDKSGLLKNKDYGQAITDLIQMFIPSIDTNSKFYKNQLEKIMSQTTGKEYKFIKNKAGEIDFKETFKESLTLQVLFTYDINGKKIAIDSQVAKKIMLKTVLDQNVLDSTPPGVKRILEQIKKDVEKIKTTPIITEGLQQGEDIKESMVKGTALTKINNSYVKDISNFIKKEVVVTAKGKGSKDVYTGLVYEKIQTLLKNKYSKIFSKNHEIFSDRAYMHESSQMKETGGFLTADSVAKILSILFNYVEVYYSVTGSAPTKKEIGQIMGEATKEAFGDTRILQRLTKESSKKK
jgi:hypothetical protein